MGRHSAPRDDSAIVIADLRSGKPDEENSLTMNDIMTDVEASFDEIYLNYPRHKIMQLRIDRIRLHGNKVRQNGQPMRGLLITGPTGSGKTTGVQKYVKHLVREGAYEGGRMPVLYVRLRKKVTVLKLLRSILQQFGDRHALKRNEDELITQVRNCIERASVEIIVIDECQHLRNRSTDNMEVTDQLKTFLDDSIAPVVFVGVNEAQAMFDDNPQLAGRCAEPVVLAPLDVTNPTDVNLLTTFLGLLDDQMMARGLTKFPSDLASPYNVTCLHLASGGVIGQACRIVRAALLIATSRGADFVEPYDLSLAVDRWAVRTKICASNPYLDRVLQAQHLAECA